MFSGDILKDSAFLLKLFYLIEKSRLYGPFVGLHWDQVHF